MGKQIRFIVTPTFGLNTATNILVTVFAGMANTINLRNAAALSTLYVHGILPQLVVYLS
jgi:hypothetical protein